MQTSYSKHHLANGLRLILVPDKTKEVVTTLVMVGTGSRYESDEEAGISHILEHLVYKGTKKRPDAMAVAEFIEGIGGEHNAFTSKEYTGFYTKVAAKHLLNSIDFLSDLLVNPLLREADLDREKQVILQEFDMYEDMPMEVVMSKFEEALFGHNSLGRDVIGYRESIKKSSAEKVIKYRSRHYTAPNIVIVIAGNISVLSESELIKSIEGNFQFSSGKVTPITSIKIPKTKRQNITIKKTEQTHLAIGFESVPYDSDDRITSRLLSMILGGSMSSRMFVEIREKLGLAYAVRTSSNSYRDTGSIDTYAGVPHDKVYEAISAIISEYKKVVANISEPEFLRAKEIIFGRMLIGLENTNELANHFAISEMFLKNTMAPEKMIEQYQALSIKDVHNLAKNTFVQDRMALSIISPSIDKKLINKHYNF
jgi:predicted Zn-dependent peptidase